MKPDDITIEKVLDLNETKQIRPLCLVHQRWLFILVPGFKSYAFDFYTLRHIAFPALQIPVRVREVMDWKAIVTNERELVVVNCIG